MENYKKQHPEEKDPRKKDTGATRDQQSNNNDGQPEREWDETSEHSPGRKRSEDMEDTDEPEEGPREDEPEDIDDLQTSEKL